MDLSRGADGEASRLKAVRRYHVLDTPPEDSFDRIARMAMSVLDMPMAFITLVDEHRVWLKSSIGVPAVLEVPRNTTICSKAIHSALPTVVEDLREDDRFNNLASVQAEEGLRFYAGAPLTTADGFRLGTICVCDQVPRTISGAQLQILKDFSDVVMEMLETRRTAASLKDTLQEDLLPKTVTVCAWTKLIRDQDEWVQPSTYLQRHFGLKVTHGLNEEAEDQIMAEIDDDEGISHN